MMSLCDAQAGVRPSGASCLLPVMSVSHLIPGSSEILFVLETYDLALIFLLLRLRRLTRFFLHLALIVNDWDCWWG